MDDTPILTAHWPPDLDPADVPFRTRSVTVLTRQGYFDHPNLFDTLTEAVAASWWYERAIKPVAMGGWGSLSAVELAPVGA